jgi:hypothetical protein
VSRRRKPTELDRERQIRVGFVKLKEMLARDPELARRTHAALTGRLAAPDLEEETDVSNEEQVSIRLPTELLDRAEKLARKLAADPTHSTVFRVTRAAALRMALLRGVEALEADLASKGKK